MKSPLNIFIIIFIYFFICAGFAGAKEVHVTMQKGDTLYKIAKKYNISVDILIKYNKITDSKNVKEGTIIKIPVVYTVKKGDTLYSIARKFKVLVKDLIDYNAITDIKKIKIGQVLIIPSAGNDEINSDPEPPDPKDDPSLLWPHKGKKEVLDGKLKGIIILGQSGDTVVSVSTGKVIWADMYRGYGKMVLVKAQDGFIYLYAGNEKLLVTMGEEINISTPIGLLGKNPHDGIPRIYFCVYKNGKPIDPYKAPRM